MRLARLFERPDWTQEKLAAEVRRRGLPRTHQSTISRLKNETRPASGVLALVVEDATGGLVKAEELPLTGSTRGLLRRIRRANTRARRIASGARP